jgi:hypothetical protein
VPVAEQLVLDRLGLDAQLGVALQAPANSATNSSKRTRKGCSGSAPISATRRTTPLTIFSVA